MKKLFFIFALALATAAIAAAGSGAGLAAALLPNFPAQTNREAGMAYCTVADLQDTYGEDRISAWSRVDPDRADKAIYDAEAEIDGYLLSGGYAVPLTGTPSTIRKYCVDIACANLIISAGVLESDPGGDAVIEQAKIARRYLEKVAEGKFKIPEYSAGGGEAAGPPSGNVQARSMERLDLRGYC
jgi:phage gp36-like protein